MKNKLRRLTVRAGLPAVIAVLSILIVASLLLWRLQSLVPGWSASELATRVASLNVHTIVNNPLNAPFTVLAYGLHKLLPHSVLAVRLVSVLYGAITVCLFFYVVRCWHSPRIAWLSSLLFVTSSWFLRTARLGTPDVLLFGLLMLTALGLWLQRTHHHRFVLFLTATCAALSLYIPGLIWFVAYAAFWQRHILMDRIKRTPTWLAAAAIIGALVVFFPLAWGINQHWQLVWAVLGLPSRVPPVVSTLKHLADVPLNVFARGSFLPGLWVGRSPVLDVFGSALFIFGVYAYWQHRRLARFASLLGIFIVTTILVALGGPVTLSLLLPFVYLVIATGMAFLLGEWLSVFPRNPLARGLGLSIVIIAVLLSCSYQLNRYFVAWPKEPQTKVVFSLQPPPS